MRIAAKLLGLILISTVIVAGIVFKASAQDPSLTQQQLNQIVSNCTSVKFNLNQLHVSDALLRVNMGQRYELVSTKLMDRFNNRIASNNLKINGLNESAISYKTTLDSFRADYIAYEESLSSAIRVNCENQPGLFYDSVKIAQLNRGKVYADVINLMKYINNYRAEVSNFESAFLSIGAK